MRRSLMIDDKLLNDARAALGTGTIRETVEVALREAVRRRRLQQLRKVLGTIDLDLTREELLSLRNER